MNINLGKKLNTIPGFMDGAVNFIFRIVSDFSESTLDTYDAANNYYAIGEYIGDLTKKFLSSEVATF
jgi:hypothetical protein